MFNGFINRTHRTSDKLLVLAYFPPSFSLGFLAFLRNPNPPVQIPGYRPGIDKHEVLERLALGLFK